MSVSSDNNKANPQVAPQCLPSSNGFAGACREAVDLGRSVTIAPGLSPTSVRRIRDVLNLSLLHSGTCGSNFMPSPSSSYVACKYSETSDESEA